MVDDDLKNDTVTVDDSRRELIALLQLAYSGELAAAYAYRGHWNSVRDANQRASIQSIEEDEWRHRKLVGEMLASLAAAADKWRELRATIIGQKRRFGFRLNVYPSVQLMPIIRMGELLQNWER